MKELFFVNCTQAPKDFNPNSGVDKNSKQASPKKFELLFIYLILFLIFYL